MAVTDPVDARLLAALAELGKAAVHELGARLGMDPREVAYRLVALSGSGLPLLVGVECDPNGLRAALAGAWQGPAGAAQAGVAQAGQAGGPQAGPGQGGPGQVGQAGPPQAGPGQAGPARGGPPPGAFAGQPPQSGAHAVQGTPSGAYNVQGTPSGVYPAQQGHYPVQGTPSGPYAAPGGPSGPYQVQGGASGPQQVQGGPSGPQQVQGTPSGPYQPRPTNAPMGQPQGVPSYAQAGAPASAQQQVRADPVMSTWGVPQSASWARGDQPANGSGGGFSPNAASANSANRPGRIGDVLPTEGLEGEQLTVQLLEVQDPADFLFGAAGYSLQPGERSVVVHTEVTNTGRIPFISLPDNYLELVADDGSTVSKAPVSLTSRPPHKIGVQPGETLGGHTVYVLPDATRVVSIRWNRRPESDECSLTWSIED